jgi:hypothetical protein
MNQQRAHQHLRDRDGVARRRTAGAGHAEDRGKQADDAADEDRRPHVHVRRVCAAFPRERRYPDREHDPGNPLERHQPREHAVGACVDGLAVLLEEFRRAAARGHRLARPTIQP